MGNRRADADGTVLPTNATTAIRNGSFNKVPQLIDNTAEEGKLFSSAFKVDDYTRVKWMNGTYLRTTTGLQLQDVVEATIVSPLTVDNYNICTFNNANGVIPAPSITTAAFWGLSNASNTAYYPQVPLYAYNFKWNEQPAPWNDVYGAWHAEDLTFIFGNFTMSIGVRCDLTTGGDFRRVALQVGVTEPPTPAFAMGVDLDRRQARQAVCCVRSPSPIELSACRRLDLSFSLLPASRRCVRSTLR